MSPLLTVPISCLLLVNQKLLVLSETTAWGCGVWLEIWHLIYIKGHKACMQHLLWASSDATSTYSSNFLFAPGKSEAACSFWNHCLWGVVCGVWLDCTSCSVDKMENLSTTWHHLLQSHGLDPMLWKLPWSCIRACAQWLWHPCPVENVNLEVDTNLITSWGPNWTEEVGFCQDCNGGGLLLPISDSWGWEQRGVRKLP